MLGQDAYPDLFTKAAALLHSLADHHPLVDGNKRLAWLATYVLLAKNGIVLDADDDAAYESSSLSPTDRSATSPRSQRSSPRSPQALPTDRFVSGLHRP